MSSKKNNESTNALENPEEGKEREGDRPSEPSSDEDSSAGIEPDLIDKLPPEARKVVVTALSTQHRYGQYNPISEKITSEHIDKILDITEKEDDRDFKESQSVRRYFLVYLLIFVAIFVFLTVFLVGSETELYKELIKLLAVFAGGFGGGFGLKSHMNQDK
jgi:hypothetical protein